MFCAIFSMAAAYLALKVGQGIEAAIPIAILAIGLSPLFTRKSTILENVIIQSIGANSSHVVSGAVFTIPALYMLAAESGSGVAQPSVVQVMMVSFLGGCLGILFLIPLRYHFMVEMHGQFPWPDGAYDTGFAAEGVTLTNPETIEADLTAVFGPGLTGVMVPKLRSADDLEAVIEVLEALEASLSGGDAQAAGRECRIHR